MPRPWKAAIALLFLTTAASAQQSITIYDDALQNGFQNFSYGGGVTFGSVEQAHTGANSIKIIGNAFNAASFARPANPFSTAQYPVLHFWVHGGATGGQQLALVVYNGNPTASAALDPYISGGVVAGAWHEVTVNLAEPPFSAVMVDRIDIQSDAQGAQAAFYIDDVVVQSSGPAAPSAAITIEHDVPVANISSDRFTWMDSSNQPRVAVLSHNRAQDAGLARGRGGALREFRYQLPNGVQRVAGLTGYGIGDAGFGYIVSHSGTFCGVEDSFIGGFLEGAGFERVFEGRHHVIHRFRQNYPRVCQSDGSQLNRTIPVTIDWIFSTGRDNPVWAITYDIDQANPAAGPNVLLNDSRAPYGELAIDGSGFDNISGTAWGDRFKFTSTTSPVTLNSSWTWTQPNTVPYVKEWLTGPLTGDNRLDATMGIVQTQTNAQQDAGGGRESGITNFWGKTSAQGNACGAMKMPCPNDWPYQANANSLEGAPGGNNNARLTWKTQFGFIGSATYPLLDGSGLSAPGYPKKSYSTYIILGTHSSAPVEAQVTQVETVQSLMLGASVGAVVTSGPAGITRADNVTYSPAGYNHVYGALAFNAAGNMLTANINVGNGTLKKPLIIVGNYTGNLPQVRLGGVTLAADADYYLSQRVSANELWITLNRDLSGAVNQFEIVGSAGAPAQPMNVVATAINGTRVDVTWSAVAGAVSYQVDRMSAGGGFTQIATPATNAYSDLGVMPGNAYLYRVRAVNASGTSVSSSPDVATTIFFTDSPLAAGTPIKAVHLSELRSAILAVRTLAGAGGFGFTDAAVAGTVIKAVHVTEMRSALDGAAMMLGLPVGGYVDGALGGVVVKAVHFQQLRDRVQ